MSATITIGGVVLSPSAVTGYESTREGRALVHEILGRSDPDVTLRPAGMRIGTIKLAFTGPDAEVASLNAEAAHAGGRVAVLTSDLGTVSMSYIVPRGGRLVRRLSPATGTSWYLEVDYQEVLA